MIRFVAPAPADIEGAISAAKRSQVTGVLVPGTPLFNRNRSALGALLLKHRLPAVGYWSGFAEAGFLMAYGPSLSDEFCRAAIYVDKILRGARAADLPVERPTRFQLLINVKTAKALGLTIPPSLLLQADRVIE